MVYKTAVVILLSLLINCSFFVYGAEISSEPEAKISNRITIQEGISRVLKDNRLIKITFFDNDMAYQDSLAARSVLLPQLNLTAVKTYNRYQNKMKFGSQEVPTSDKDPFSFGVDVYQTLFDFGKSLSHYRASKDLFKAAKAHAESVKRIATLEFIVAYFNFLETDKMIAVYEKEVDSLASYLKDMERLYEQGSAVKNDLLPTQVKLADARQKLISAQNEKEITRARLNNILALPLRENTEVQDIQMDPPELPGMESAWVISQAQRPEIVFYAEQISASISAERAKAVENFPVLFAEGGYTHTQNKYQVHEGNASAGLGVKMNFYDGGTARAELLKERSWQKQLKEQKDKIIEDIKFEVEDSYYSLKNSCEKIAVAKDVIEQADENVRVYRVKYMSGSATATDVLEAIALQTTAQTNYYSADYELKRNYAKLEYSIGMDLISIYEKPGKDTK
ncbi:MAG: TolC family protein [Candidatus Omnitrophica bacterium]|nr:TolC family protein [Candidatus Omnitrophota bacterium]